MQFSFLHFSDVNRIVYYSYIDFKQLEEKKVILLRVTPSHPYICRTDFINNKWLDQ